MKGYGSQGLVRIWLRFTIIHRIKRLAWIIINDHDPTVLAKASAILSPNDKIDDKESSS
jgi:hypothetical protein